MRPLDAVYDPIPYPFHLPFIALYTPLVPFLSSPELFHSLGFIPHLLLSALPLWRIGPRENRNPRGIAAFGEKQLVLQDKQITLGITLKDPLTVKCLNDARISLAQRRESQYYSTACWIEGIPHTASNWGSKKAEIREHLHSKPPWKTSIGTSPLIFTVWSTRALALAFHSLLEH